MKRLLQALLLLMAFVVIPTAASSEDFYGIIVLLYLSALMVVMAVALNSMERKCRRGKKSVLQVSRTRPEVSRRLRPIHCRSSR